MSEMLGEHHPSERGRHHSVFFTSNNRLISSLLSDRVILDILATFEVALAFSLAYLIKYAYFFGKPVDERNYFWLIILSCAFLYFMLKRVGLYQTKFAFQPLKIIPKLFISVILSLALTLAFLFIIKGTAYFSRAWFIGWYISLFFVLLLSRFVWCYYLKTLHTRGFFRQNTVLIGFGETLGFAQQILDANIPGRQVVNTIDLAQLCNTDATEIPCSEHVQAVDNIVRDAQNNMVDKVILALPVGQEALFRYLVVRLRMLPIEVKLIPNFGNFVVPIQSLEDENGVQLLGIQRKPIHDWGVFLKIIEDYVLGGLLLFAFLPAMALIAIAIKLDSRGPVLFRQRRHGFNHEVIQVCKFRTMSVLEDGNTIRQATQNDERVTRVGRFLRKTSLDELPQLFNVLKGDMSLVGPRPHALAHNNYYSKLLENYATRHRVKPGITGWAQINGFRGEITDETKMQLRINYDLDYIDNWSIWFDLKIILQTPFYGFVSRNAY